MPCTLQSPFCDIVISSWGMFLASWAGPPGMRHFFCFSFIGLSPSTLRFFILQVWAILVARSIRVVVCMASVPSAIPYTCEQHYSSTIAPACYMSMAILLRCWGKQQYYLGLGLLVLRENDMLKIIPLIQLTKLIVSTLLSGNTYRILFFWNDIKHYFLHSNLPEKRQTMQENAFFGKNPCGYLC